MLSFFTDPYPNELLYSAISRYHYYIGNNNFKDTTNELYREKKEVSNLYFGAYINNLVKSLGGLYNEDDLIFNHTIFPFYKPFLSEQSIADKIDKMKISNPNFGYLINSCLFKNNRLYYCPKCVQEDVKKYGEAYFHREHHLNGIAICPHHKLILKAYNDKRMGGETKKFEILNYNALDLEEKNVDNIVLSYDVYDRMCEISDLSYELFISDISVLNKHNLCKAYKNILIREGLASQSGIIKIKKVKEEMLNYYGEKFLNGLNCNVEVDKKSNWIDYIFTDNDYYFNPIKQILVINFLGKNISDIIYNIDNSYKPFGEGPWPCMNKFCKHYKQNIINNVSIRRNPKVDDTGIFICNSCGYKYSRNLSNEDMYKVNKTVRWGKIWHDKLEEYVNEDTYSVYELSQIMGCSPDTIIRKLNDLKKRKSINIEIKVPNEKKLEESKTILLKKIEIKDLYKTNEFKYIDMYDPNWLSENFNYDRQEVKNAEEYLKLYKQQILDLIQSNPNITRRELHGIIKEKKYGLLKKYDPIWLEENLPKRKEVKHSIDTTKNWEEQDQKLLELLKQKYTEIINRDYIVKISKRLLRNEIGEISMNDYSLKKMPNSSEYINSITDNHRSYRIKYYKKYIKEKYFNNNYITIEVIPKNFHEFSKYKKDETVIKELEDYIEELKSNY